MASSASPTQDTRAPGGEPVRAFPPLAERVLIIGLDGATFTVLERMMVEERMPRLKDAIENGARGTLYSTVPPITPAAWTTFLTGRLPGSHRVLDFESYDAFTGHLNLNSASRSSHVRNVWQILSDLGFKVGSVNVPMTYPPIDVNGFMVSGFDAPGPDSDFASPRELREEILERWPDPTLKSKWKRKMGGGDKLFARNLEYLSNSFDQGAEMTMHLGRKYGWHALMVVLKLVDNLQHKTWKYLDERWMDRTPKRRDMVKGCLERLDKAVGTLLDYASENGATVLMVSDHGHGSLEGKVYPNRLLEKWGYLKLRGAAARAVKKGQEVLRRWTEPSTEHVGVHGIERHLPVVLSKTRACVMHAGNAGFLFFNLKGREPTGIVDPSEFEALRDELIERFRSDDCRVRAPSGEMIELFPEVHKPEELYNVSREDEPWLPDLILIQHEILAVVRRMHGGDVVRWLPYRRIEGTHRKEGILIATGPGIGRRTDISATLEDCAPTMLAMMGLKVPDNMEGRVITELFERPPDVETVAADQPAAVACGDQDPSRAYSQKEEQQITQRLADLGYLE